MARVVPHDDLLDVSKELLAQCCRTAPGARGVIKSSLDGYLGLFDRIGMQSSLFGPEAREGAPNVEPSMAQIAAIQAALTPAEAELARALAAPALQATVPDIEMSSPMLAPRFTPESTRSGLAPSTSSIIARITQSVGVPDTANRRGSMRRTRTGSVKVIARLAPEGA